MALVFTETTTHMPLKSASLERYNRQRNVTLIQPRKKKNLDYDGKLVLLSLGLKKSVWAL